MFRNKIARLRLLVRISPLYRSLLFLELFPNLGFCDVWLMKRHLLEKYKDPWQVCLGGTTATPKRTINCGVLSLTTLGKPHDKFKFIYSFD